MDLSKTYRNYKKESRNPGHVRGAITTLGTKGGRFQKERKLWTVGLPERT